VSGAAGGGRVLAAVTRGYLDDALSLWHVGRAGCFDRSGGRVQTVKKQTAIPQTRSKGWWETVRTLVYAVAIALAVRTLLYEPFNIPSGSMKPTLLIGDYLFVSKFAYGYSKHSLPFSLPLFEGRLFGSLPERGDVVVFKLPSDNRTDYIKRIVGLPGDELQVIDGILHVNGEPAARVRVEDFHDDDGTTNGSLARYRETLPDGKSFDVLDLSARGSLDNTKVYKVPEGHVFAMGDNRDNSLDSRVDGVGFIPIENLIGRAEIIFFSTNGSARLWEIWKWPATVRYGRMFHLID
jgi:signal peptidase I